MPRARASGQCHEDRVGRSAHHFSAARAPVDVGRFPAPPPQLPPRGPSHTGQLCDAVQRYDQMVRRDVPGRTERMTDVQTVDDVLREVCAGIRSIEEPLQLRTVLGGEAAEQLSGRQSARSGLDAAIDKGHAGERHRVERTEPEQRVEVLTPRPVEEQVVPSDEVGDNVTDAPACTERVESPLLGGEPFQETSEIAALLSHERPVRVSRLALAAHRTTVDRRRGAGDLGCRGTSSCRSEGQRLASANRAT